MRLRVDGLVVDRGGARILDGCVLAAEPGELVGLIGPNGSGKSTLLRSVYRALSPVAGAVLLDGDDVRKLDAREAARRMAVVTQERPTEFDFSVVDVVMMGRTPHKGLLERDGAVDRQIVASALDRVGIRSLARRSFSTLSGGEKQRVLLARALAQESRVLVLDEPTNHLDVHAQLELLELVRSLGRTTVAALHDLNLAAAYCDRIYVLDAGRVVADGPPTAVLRPDLIARVFSVHAHCGPHPADGRFHVHLSPLPPPAERSPLPEETP